jgi:outer membrane receptor for ferrienterochelin and colicin
MTKSLPQAIAACLLCPTIAFAQSSTLPATAPAKPVDKPGSKNVQSAETSKIQTVEVEGAHAMYDPRRDDTASKTVLNSEEIQKFGDTNVYEVLKRAPGVTVTGNTIRMRGLGAGYTQILVDGDRPPPGFSLDNLTPDQIERIEVIRSASAEFSMQSIAGTINIVLRKIVTKPQRDLRVSGTHSAQGRNGTVSGTWAEKVGKPSYFLNGAVYAGHNESTTWSQDQFASPPGTVTQFRESLYNGGG